MFYCSVITFRQQSWKFRFSKVCEQMSDHPSLPSQVFCSSADLAVQKELDPVPRRYHSVLKMVMGGSLGEI